MSTIAKCSLGLINEENKSSMCGRYRLSRRKQIITEDFETDPPKDDGVPRYNIAPTQFSDQEAGRDLFPAHDEIRARVDAMARFYGMLAGVTYGEPFLQKEVGLVDDLLAIPVKSI